MNSCRTGILVLGMVLAGCTNLIETIALAPGQTPALNKPVDFVLTGVGKCQVLSVDWGDGRSENSTFVDLASQPHFTHTYSDWAGGKTVTVNAVAGCGGTAQTRFKTSPAMLSLGWVRDPLRDTRSCHILSEVLPVSPDLVANSIVHITSPASPQVNFGCSFNGCIYDADGKPGSSASSAFLFPGLREYSLVLRIAGQAFQAGKSTQLMTTTGGLVEICQNIWDKSANITGGWEVDIEVDELGK